MRQNRLTMLLAVAGAICVTASVGHAQAKVTTSAGDVATLSQKHVVHHMIVGDSLELEAAQLAASKTQNAAVRDLANALATDNRAHLENLRKLAAKSDLGREANAADSSAASSARDYAQLQSTADAAFDQAFVNGQIESHTREIAALKTLRASVKDDDLQQDIDAALPVIERHLEQAKTVAAQLGAPADAAKKPPTDAAADKPAADKPAADKAAADKPAADKAAADKPADAKAGDAKPADAKPADAKPAGAKPDSTAKKPLPPKPPTI